jgi:hypothetical protein
MEPTAEEKPAGKFTGVMRDGKITDHQLELNPDAGYDDLVKLQARLTKLASDGKLTPADAARMSQQVNDALGNLKPTLSISKTTEKLVVGYQMNDRQGKLLLLAATVLIAMLLYPPFVKPVGNGYTRHAGYASLVFHKTELNNSYYTGSVNIPLLATQELVVAAAFAAVYFYLGRKRNA